MKNLAIGAALAAAAVSQAQLGPISVSLDVLTNTKYVWRGVNLVNDPVRQPSLTVASGAWSANFWGNQELSDVNNYYGNSTGEGRITEWDSTLCYNGSAKMGSYCVGVVHYDFPNTGFRSTTEAFVSATASMPLSPTLAVYRDLDEVDGTYFQASVSHSMPSFKFLDGRNATVTLKAAVGAGDKKHNNFYYGNDKASFGDGSIGLTMNVENNANSSFYLSAAYTTLLDKSNLQGRDNRSNLLLGGGFVVRF